MSALIAQRVRAEVAALLGIPAGTAKSRLRPALRRLATALRKQDGVEP